MPSLLMYEYTYKKSTISIFINADDVDEDDEEWKNIKFDCFLELYEDDGLTYLGTFKTEAEAHFQAIQKIEKFAYLLNP